MTFLYVILSFPCKNVLTITTLSLPLMESPYRHVTVWAHDGEDISTFLAQEAGNQSFPQIWHQLNSFKAGLFKCEIVNKIFLPTTFNVSQQTVKTFIKCTLLISYHYLALAGWFHRFYGKEISACVRHVLARPS